MSADLSLTVLGLSGGEAWGPASVPGSTLVASFADTVASSLGVPSWRDVAKLEAMLNFAFPPDLRAVLQVGVPESWHDYNALASGEVQVGSEDDTVTSAIKWHASFDGDDPRRGTTFADVKEFLEEEDRGKDASEVIARRNLHPMIPIMDHRMMPTVPCRPGLPVLSMHQCTDNIVYGENLWLWMSEPEGDVEADPSLIPEEWTARKMSVAELPFRRGFLS